MTIETDSSHSKSIESALKTGLSAKAGSVYVALLDAGQPLSPKTLIVRTGLHRQYVYDALKELDTRGLLMASGKEKRVKYAATSPDRLLQDAEKKRIDALEGVRSLMKLYDRSPAGIVEIVKGSEAVIEAELQTLRDAKEGDFLDIVGGAGMNFVKLFEGHMEPLIELYKEKKISLRYIGSGEDVEFNRTKSPLKNESRTIPGIGNIVNVCIRPESVSFCIYEPEIIIVRVRNREAVDSQKALFEVLWNVAK